MSAADGGGNTRGTALAPGNGKCALACALTSALVLVPADDHPHALGACAAGANQPGQGHVPVTGSYTRAHVWFLADLLPVTVALLLVLVQARRLT